MKTIKITEFPNNKNLTANKNIIEYEPNFIYIPLFDNNEKYESLVNVGDKVKIGQLVAITKENKLFMHSSISGEVVSLNKKMWTNTGKLVSCIEIKNDYLNEKISNYNNTYFANDSIIEQIKNNGIVGMGGAGFPTYLKYKNGNLNILIINGCECEPFLTCDYRLMVEKTLKLINGIHYVLMAINGEKAIIAIKKGKKEVYDLLNKYIDDKISIYEVPDEYPVGYERYLVENILKKKYKNIPNEVGVVVNNVSTVIAIYDAIKFNSPLIKRVVTFSGYCLNNQVNVYCNIGTSVKEVLDNVCKLKTKYHRKHITCGGLMTGKSMMSDDIIVTKTLNSIIVNPYLRKQDNIVACIGCGKCADVCPVKLTPIEIHKYYLYKNKNELKALKADWCIGCGSCSYICPSRIDLTINTIKARDYIKRG